MSSDPRLEERLGRVLRVGAGISSSALALGLIISLSGLSPKAAALFLQAGLVMLIGTPIARVLASAISYFVERDWPYVVLTSIVLAELAAAVVAAFRM